tara:strand:+ start:2136 stop:2579 length:444 start_codon:yes stop_codon:yes gene_type:complete
VTDISFYHAVKTAPDIVLPTLLEKILKSGSRAVVQTISDERVEMISGLLWTHEPNSFLPHGTRRDGNSTDQPIWITAEEENPNSSEILVLIDGSSVVNLRSYNRCLFIFDGSETALASARARWLSYKEAGHRLRYWQETAKGSWRKR